MVIKFFTQIIAKLPFFNFISESKEYSTAKNVLVVLIIFILALLVLSLAYMVVTLFLRLKNYLKAKKWDKLEKSWHDGLLDIIRVSLNIQIYNLIYTII